MRRNRKVKKNSVLTSGTCWVVALIVSLLIGAMGNYVLDAQCNQLAGEIGNAEKRLSALEAECGREAARWADMKVREKLDNTLQRFGLEMKSPRHDQIVRMDPDGRPTAKSHTTLARARARMRTETLALNDVPGTPRSGALSRTTVKRVSPLPATKRTVRR